MATYGQLVQFGPFFSGGLLCTLKLYHYASGTTTLKDVYTDREKTTTAAQPVVSDANGIVSFFADGLHKFRIDGATDGVTYTTLYTYDKWAVGDQSSTLSGEGAALSSASTLTLGTDGDFFHVTGTVATTAISGSQNEVTLVADAAWPLTHSGNLILQDGISYTAVIGDVFKFRNEGAGVWRQIAITKRPIGISLPASLGTIGQALRVTGLTTQTFGASPGLLWGCTLSNGTDTVNDINITAGEVSSDDGAFSDRVVMSVSAITKQLDAAWAVGTNAGGRMSAAAIANTTYHVWVIQRPDTGVVDVGFDVSATAPTMPANYTKKRRIGSILREAATLIQFTQDGDYIRRQSAILDYNTDNPGTSAITTTLSVPTGINVMAFGNAFLVTGSGASIWHMSDLIAADDAPSITVGPLGSLYANSVEQNNAAPWSVRTNTSAQARHRLSASAAGVVVRLATLGWIDTRGRLA